MASAPTQDITPLNSTTADALAAASGAPWIPMDAGSSMRVLWTGAETGRWAVVFRWPKGYVAGRHKHLSAAHTYVLSGLLGIRDTRVGAGDYLYEANGMIHDETIALDDTEYLFICDGPVIFLGPEDQVMGYLGWEEIQRMHDAVAGS